MANNKKIARVVASVDAGASASEIAQEAYRVCRINSYLRKDLQQAGDDLRKNSELEKKQAVQEDALNELREELYETRKLLKRAWILLEQKNAKIPGDMRMAYDALRTANPHDWQRKKGTRVTKEGASQQQSEKGSKAKKEKRKGKGKANGKEETKDQVAFLLHTHEGKTYNAREPIPDNDSDEDTDSPATESGNALDGDDTTHAPPQGSFSADAPSVSTLKEGELASHTTGAVRRQKAPPKPNPFAALKIPKVVQDPEEGVTESANSTIAIPVVEGTLTLKVQLQRPGSEGSPELGASPPAPEGTLITDNAVAGVKRKNPTDMGAAMKKTKIDEELEEGEIDEKT